MPYISTNQKAMLDPFLGPLTSRILNRGELTYCLTKMVLSQLPPKGERNYAALSSLRATLHDASDEFYWRVMRPFEDKKIEANGDVYDQ